MSELSTRVWLDERLWDSLRERAIAEGTTVRDLILRLVSLGVRPQALAAAAATSAPVAALALPPPRWRQRERGAASETAPR